MQGGSASSCAWPSRPAALTARSLGAPVIAVATGLGSTWALDTFSTLYRIDSRTARVTRRIPTGATAAYNIWIGGGAVWVADDQGARVLRISPTTGKVVASIPVGDGPQTWRSPESTRG